MSAPNDPPPPEQPAGTRQPSTQEIPVPAPAGATAVTKHPLPPHPDAAPPAPVPPTPTPTPTPTGVPVAGPQPTGPVDFVPGLPGLGAPPVPPPPAPPLAQTPARTTPGGPAATTETGSARAWPDTLESEVPAQGRSRGSRTGSGPRDRTALLGLGLAALALVLVLLGLTLDFGTVSSWSVVPLWSSFATLCALLGLLAFAASRSAGDRLRPGSSWRAAAAGLVGLSVFWLLVVLPVADTDRGFVLTAALACLGGALWIGPRSRV